MQTTLFKMMYDLLNIITVLTIYLESKNKAYPALDYFAFCKFDKNGHLVLLCQEYYCYVHRLSKLQPLLTEKLKKYTYITDYIIIIYKKVETQFSKNNYL